MHSERRTTARLGCCYQVGVRLNGLDLPATVRDMGLGGMRLLIPHAVEPDTTLQVSQIGGELANVAVRVVWSSPRETPEEYDVGVVYQEPPERLDQTWVKPALSQLGFEGLPPQERRRHVRVRLDVEAALHLGGETIACQLLDLGLGGALVESSHPELREGTSLDLEVKIEQGRLACRVVYIQPQDGQWRYGLAFAGDRANQALARLIEGYLVAMG